MARRFGHEPEEEDLDEEASFADDADEAEEAEDLRVCPACRSSLFGGSDRCPRCGHWLEDELHESERKPIWVLLLAALVFLVMVGGILLGVN